MTTTPLASLVETFEVRSWAEFMALQQRFSGERGRLWMYRGQSGVAATLRTSLERALNRFELPIERQEELERLLLREFRRHYHRYTADVPAEDDTLRWLALMRHHGAPVRLLDLSYSPYVALFFALDGVAHGESCSMWAIDHNWCVSRAAELLPGPTWEAFQEDPWGGKTGPTVRQLFATRTQVAVPMNPFYLDARLAIQQGVLLAPLDLSVNLDTVLQRMDSPAQVCGNVRRIVIHCLGGFLESALGELTRMNVTHTTLLPGIDGLARSLENLVVLGFMFPNQNLRRK
ncbi:MAG: FRG domain-containing protein [Gemmatimonadales bacterium]